MSVNLAVKYRPETIHELVEQDAIKKILIQQVELGRYKNSYLFTGSAGTGKTTLARAFAKAINNNLGRPIEKDVASNNSVEDVRKLISESQMKALTGEYKVYILDECHMYSTSAWNAMLKLLEEPPAKTIFIFCTTDPQKIPGTILSRVQRFDFQRISTRNIIKRLEYIIQEEIKKGSEYTFTEDALEFIAKTAEGGMRDAITMLEKCLSYTKDINLDVVVKVIGSANYETMLDLTEYLFERKEVYTLDLIDRLYREGIDIKLFIKQYTEFFLDILKYKLTSSFDLIKIPSTFKNRLDSFTAYERDFIFYVLDNLVKLNTTIKYEQNPKAMVEMQLLLMSK